MTEEDKIRDLLYRFIYSGLIEKDIDKVIGCFASKLLGIGIGEQGFVRSLEDVGNVLKSGIKEDAEANHSISFDCLEIIILEERFGVVCADIDVILDNYNAEGKTIKSRLQQSLSVIKEHGEWKICGLHASTPVVTEESIEAYPLKFAERTLKTLKEKIGEEAYLEEEQYRKAVLADAIAFYIINFTENRFEQCQLQNDVCIEVGEDTPYESIVINKLPQYVFEEDRAAFLENMSLKSIEEAFKNHAGEVSCEYRMKAPDGNYFWARTIIRLIKDIKTGAQKGIMYVKNIDQEKKEALAIRKKADCDTMTGLLNKGAMIREVDVWLKANPQSLNNIFLMVDVDDFKNVNDTYGHPLGDLVLIALSKALSDIFGGLAKIGRLGGDEFAVFIPQHHWDDNIMALIEQLLATMRSLNIPEAPMIKTSVSVGGVCLSKGDFHSFYRAADRALYEAKGSGKDRYYLL